MDGNELPSLPGGPEPGYGERFLRRLQERPWTPPLRYAWIQRLRDSDQEGVVRLLRELDAHLPYRLIQAVRELGPEEAADEVLSLYRRALLFFVFFAIVVPSFPFLFMALMT